MRNFLILCTLLLAISTRAQVIEKTYSLQFWSQQLSQTNSFPQALQSPTEFKLKSWSQSSTPALLWEQKLSTNQLTAQVQVLAPTSTYFSQQITLFLNGNLIGRCSAYFGPAEVLVPSACSARVGETLYGLSISLKQ